MGAGRLLVGWVVAVGVSVGWASTAVAGPPAPGGRSAGALAAGGRSAGDLTVGGRSAGAPAAGGGSAGPVVTVAGAAETLLSGATDLGPAPAQSRSVTLVLGPTNAGRLASFVAVAGHPDLSVAQTTAEFGPAPATLAAVTGWAAAAGLHVDSVSPDRELVHLSATTSTLGSALGVRFDRFRRADGSTFVSTVGTASLPAAIAAQTAAIVGLSDLGRVSPAKVYRASAGLGSTTSYGPKDLWSLYGAPAGQTGSGQQVSVIASGDLTSVRSDLATFESHFGLPSVRFNEIDLGPPSTDTSGADEYDLDTQYSTGMAPGVSQVNVYDAASLADQDTLTAVDRWITDGLADQASFSAGECELLAEVTGFVPGLDAVLATAAAQGKTLFVSSGDAGSQCPALVGLNGLPIGLPGVEYPASSPDAIGVGGTSILSATPLLGLGSVFGTGPTEIGWYAGGGGTSLFEATPSWQQAAGGSFLGIRRGVPDVSLDADPNSGYDVVISGVLTPGVGGTSASAPAWQGIWARAQAAHAGDLGFAGPVIYATEPPSAFRDITLGTNTLFPVTSGWDYVTGRGVPNISALVNGA
ncbi:MAG TPA: S53 family peptidase [Solirubrobacteraceae bacterium]|jgi:pseudomonalisin/xanthomonalisin|nr:S53 family peptidase [Solirubrobacteraceae bacterium]